MLSSAIDDKKTSMPNSNSSGMKNEAHFDLIKFHPANLLSNVDLLNNLNLPNRTNLTRLEQK
jgi:hypothetical protein